MYKALLLVEFIKPLYLTSIRNCLQTQQMCLNFSPFVSMVANMTPRKNLRALKKVYFLGPW